MNPRRQERGTDALAADGGIVRLRPVRPDDAAALAALYAVSSPENLRMRFFGLPGREVLEAEVARLVRPAAVDHDVMVAESKGALVGVVSYERTPEGSQAEFAVFVDDAHHGRGIGTLLLEHLAASARARGVTDLVGEILPGNTGMLRVAGDLSGRAKTQVAGGVVDVGISTVLDEATLAASDARERTAARASLRWLFAPRAVAVVGASRTPGGIGHATLQSLVEFGFAGGLYAVNPHATTVCGVASYPSLTGIPDNVDLAVIAVPATDVPKVIADAGAAGVRVAVVLSAGFSEAEEVGSQSQAELVTLARSLGIRLVGPDCLGVLNTDPAVRLAATFAPALPAPGGLALASQSGAVGIAVLDHVQRTGVGVSTFVSLGNKADVSGNDLLSYWFDDPATSAVALYLESVGNPRKFGRIARALARRKPIMAVISERSAAGQRADASHTAAAATSDVAVESLCAQAGIIRADHLGELLDAARMLTDQPLPAGDRLGIFGNASGVSVLAADAAEPAGLRVPELGEHLRRKLGGPGGGNPVDLGAVATPAAFAHAMAVLASSGEVDAVLAVVAATRANDPAAIFSALAPVADRHADLPLAVVVIGAHGLGNLGERHAPVFELPEQAVSAIGKAARYAAWRRRPLGRQPQLSEVDKAGARVAVTAALRQRSGWQPHCRVADILGRYDIDLAPTVTAVGEHAVEVEASRLGYPVAIKAAEPGLVRRSDAGAIKLGVVNARAARAAYRDIATALRERGLPRRREVEPVVLIQPMVRAQLELVAGIVHDERFGSLVMVGLGGIHTELLDDRVFRLVPLTDLDAGEMWRSLRGAPLLTGYRGSPAVDVAAVEDLLLRLGELAEDLPEIAELDLSPVLVGPDGATVVDAKMRLAPVGPEPDATLRQLRRPSW